MDEQKLDIEYISKALSRSYLELEDADKIIPWLRGACEEIESLRSQLYAEKETSALLAKQLTDEVQEHAKTVAMGQRNVAVLTDQLQEARMELMVKSDYAEELEKDNYHLHANNDDLSSNLQQAEHERDYAKEELSFIRPMVDISLLGVREANTAMREALEEVEFQIGFIEYNDTQPIKDVIASILSRYPKEGETK